MAQYHSSELGDSSTGQSVSDSGHDTRDGAPEATPWTLLTRARETVQGTLSPGSEAPRVSDPSAIPDASTTATQTLQDSTPSLGDTAATSPNVVPSAGESRDQTAGGGGGDRDDGRSDGSQSGGSDGRPLTVSALSATPTTAATAGADWRPRARAAAARTGSAPVAAPIPRGTADAVARDAADAEMARVASRASDLAQRDAQQAREMEALREAARRAEQRLRDSREQLEASQRARAGYQSGSSSRVGGDLSGYRAGASAGPYVSFARSSGTSARHSRASSSTRGSRGYSSPAARRSPSRASSSRTSGRSFDPRATNEMALSMQAAEVSDLQGQLASALAANAKTAEDLAHTQAEAAARRREAAALAEQCDRLASSLRREQRERARADVEREAAERSFEALRASTTAASDNSGGSQGGGGGGGRASGDGVPAVSPPGGSATSTPARGDGGDAGAAGGTSGGNGGGGVVTAGQDGVVARVDAAAVDHALTTIVSLQTRVTDAEAKVSLARTEYQEAVAAARNEEAARSDGRYDRLLTLVGDMARSAAETAQTAVSAPRVAAVAPPTPPAPVPQATQATGSGRVSRGAGQSQDLVTASGGGDKPVDFDDSDAAARAGVDAGASSTGSASEDSDVVGRMLASDTFARQSERTISLRQQLHRVTNRLHVAVHHLRRLDAENVALRRRLAARPTRADLNDALRREKALADALAAAESNSKPRRAGDWPDGAGTREMIRHDKAVSALSASKLRFLLAERDRRLDKASPADYAEGNDAAAMRGEEAASAHACMAIVAGLCEELHLESPADVLPTVRERLGAAMAAGPLESFAAEVCENVEAAATALGVWLPRDGGGEDGAAEGGDGSSQSLNDTLTLLNRMLFQLVSTDGDKDASRDALQRDSDAEAEQAMLEAVMGDADAAALVPRDDAPGVDAANVETAAEKKRKSKKKTRKTRTLVR